MLLSCFSCVQLCATSEMAAHQAPLSLGFSRQEYWSGLSFPSPVFQKNIYICFINYAKAFDCVDHNKLWKTLKEMALPDHLTCLLRNLYVGQEATVRTRHGTMDWFIIGEGV